MFSSPSCFNARSMRCMVQTYQWRIIIQNSEQPRSGAPEARTEFLMTCFQSSVLASLPSKCRILGSIPPLKRNWIRFINHSSAACMFTFQRAKQQSSSSLKINYWISNKIACILYTTNHFFFCWLLVRKWFDNQS